MSKILFFILIGCGSSEKELPFVEEPSVEPAEDTVTDPVEEPINDEPEEPSEEVDDLDGDGVLSDDDCDDSNPNASNTSNDHDCDGVSSDYDCNDNDATDSSLFGDCDEDGVASTDDCDDFDISIGVDCRCWEENIFIAEHFTYEEPNVSWNWGYDANGYLYVFRAENTGDWGTTTFDFTYDDLGNMLTKEVGHDDDCDGANEYTAVCTYTQGINGLEESCTQTNGSSYTITYVNEELFIKSIDNSWITSYTTHTFDASGLLRTYTKKYDWGWAMDSTTIQYAYTGVGKRVHSTKELDWPDSGLIETTSYHANGNIKEIVSLQNINDEIQEELHRFDENGERTYLQKETQLWWDSLHGYQSHEKNTYIDGVLRVVDIYDQSMNVDIFSTMTKNQSFDAQGKETDYHYIHDTEIGHVEEKREYDAQGNQTLDDYIYLEHVDYWGEVTTEERNTSTWNYVYTTQMDIVSFSKITLEEVEDCDYYNTSPCTTSIIFSEIVDAVYGYDSHNSLIEIFEQYDTDSNGVYNEESIETWNHTYDAQNNIISTLYVRDAYNDGSIEYQTNEQWTYDNNGAPIIHTRNIDSNGDGTFFLHTSENWGYENGEMTMYSIAQDTDGDAQFELQQTEHWVYILDGFGHRIQGEYTRDEGSNQTIEFSESYVWTYDENQLQNSERRTTGSVETFRSWSNVGTDKTTTQYYVQEEGIRIKEFIAMCVQ